MTLTALIGGRVLADSGWLDDHALLFENGRIYSLVPVSRVPAGADCVHLAGGMLLPGFIDTQVNGGGGTLFNETPTVEGIRAIGDAHRRFGTTGFLPTLISDELEAVAMAIQAVDAAIEEKVPGVLGIHIEGPFLNSHKRGIHDASKMRQIDPEAVELLASLKHGRTLVTLAPELVPRGLIKELTQRGVIVAAGHSLATYEEMNWAYGEGLGAVTHLFNAMSQLEGRAPGVVGSALERGDIVCGIIVDGQHVHPGSLRLAYKACGADRLMLVTDAMPTVGSTKKHFVLNGQHVVATDGACRAADGTLAGSDLDMSSVLRNTISLLNVDLRVASRMASTTAATLLGMGSDRGRLAPGYRADIVHLNDALTVARTWIAGEG
jgi:N-acetylglucosamine-6-phosphate deacetylase